MKRMLVASILGAAVAFASPAGAETSATVKQIRDRGELICGVDPNVPGYAMADASGKWTGLDPDLCVAVATAILGENPKVKYVPLSTSARFTALQSGEIDVLIRGSSYTFIRDTKMALDYAGINFVTGDAFMVKKSLGVKSALDLKDATICGLQGTATEVNVQDFARKHNLKMDVLTFEKEDELLKAYEADRCDAYSTDTGSLAGLALTMPHPENNVILPELMLGQYLGPITREGDPAFTNIVRWSHNAMLGAEEFGLTQANVDDMKANSTNPEVRRMLGVEDDFGSYLGLDKDWAYRIIKSVGNYGESYDRNFGMKSPLKLDRGYNKLWNQGGLLWSPRWN